MDVKYDIPQYLASVKMSSKKRILVEGRDDKCHIKNLILAILGDKKINIDTAENIKGNCEVTYKNNRAKIDRIHQFCKSSGQHGNLFFLCDREYLKFNIGEEIEDLMNDHENDGNLSWTLGHSLENYFIEEDLIVDAFSYLSGSEFKVQAMELFKKVLPSAVKVVASITLSAKDIERCSYPSGTIGWEHFLVNHDRVEFDIEKWSEANNNEIGRRFISGYSNYVPVVERTRELICSRICRGHTSILMLQRIFSCCLYLVGKGSDEAASRRDSISFGSIRESAVSNALSEAWIRRVKMGKAQYPTILVEAVA